MTPTERRELGDWIAEHVLGLRDHSTLDNGLKFWDDGERSMSSEGFLTWQGVGLVMEKLREDGYLVRISCYPDGHTTAHIDAWDWGVREWRGVSYSRVEGGDVPLAVMQAARQATLEMRLLGRKHSDASE